MDGFFSPAVAVGTLVKRGQLLGTVCSLLGDVVREIPAETDGKVLVLSTFPRVRAGETLGVVVELGSGDNVVSTQRVLSSI
jgi:predicted deacylase